MGNGEGEREGKRREGGGEDYGSAGCDDGVYETESVYSAYTHDDGSSPSSSFVCPSASFTFFTTYHSYCCYSRLCFASACGFVDFKNTPDDLFPNSS